MLAWLSEHGQALSAAASLGMLVVWILYLQLFFRMVQRQRRPNLLIHQAGGFELDGRCIVANMSETAVHVAAVLVDVEHDPVEDDRARRDDSASDGREPGGRRVTFQPRPVHGRNDGEALADTRQGPLGSGRYLDLGSFAALLDAADRGHRAEDELGAALTVRVVAFVGSELYPAGARRRFRISGRRHDATVQPESLLPEQLSSARQRRVARRWLAEAQRLDVATLETPTVAEPKA
jgi:hypothetical protein